MAGGAVEPLGGFEGSVPDPFPGLHPTNEIADKAANNAKIVRAG
jgi:hypothetical protein